MRGTRFCRPRLRSSASGGYSYFLLDTVAGSACEVGLSGGSVSAQSPPPVSPMLLLLHPQMLSPRPSRFQMGFSASSIGSTWGQSTCM